MLKTSKLKDPHLTARGQKKVKFNVPLMTVGVKMPHQLSFASDCIFTNHTFVLVRANLDQQLKLTTRLHTFYLLLEVPFEIDVWTRRSILPVKSRIKIQFMKQIDNQVLIMY